MGLRPPLPSTFYAWIDPVSGLGEAAGIGVAVGAAIAAVGVAPGVSVAELDGCGTGRRPEADECDHPTDHRERIDTVFV